MPSEGSSSKPALKGKIDDCLRSILDGLTKSGPSHLPGSTVDDLAKRDPLFFLIAGEASGDLLGARLMKALKAKLGGRARFMGVGGPRMQAEGIELLFPHTEIMHFGIVEVLKHIPRLLRRIRETANAVVEAKPAALITIDSPDFSFRVAKRVRKRAGDKIRLIHYVAPTVWAWRPGRAKKIAKFLDLLLAVLPFEPPYFESEGLPCTFVGHSVIESGADKGDGEAFRKMHGVSEQTPLLTVLPGSRTSEIDRLLPIFGETVRLLQGKHPDLRLVVPTVAHLKDRVRQETSAWGVPVAIVESEQDKYDAFAASDAALACSGTVALELALARLPAVIAYKLNALTVFLFRHLIRVKYVNLVNIMHDEMAVPELLQSDCTPAKLADAIETLLSDKAARKKQIARLETAAKWLSCGAQLPSECAAEAVLSAVAPPVVLQVLPALVTGGVERGTVETAAALVKAGFRAIVASEGGPMAAQIEAAGGMHITLPLASKNPLTILMNARRLSKIIREHKVDIVHARSRAPAWSAWLAAKETGALFVTTFHNAYGAKSALKRRYNSAMAKGRRIIAISDFVADYAKRTYGVSKDILTVVPRGVDIDTFAPDKVEPGRVAALRKAWDLEGPGFAILLPGRFSRWKGHSVLIEALKQMDRRDVVCVFAGGGKDSAYGHELAAEIAEKGLKNNVRIVDACDDMPAAYLAADVVVVPSTRPEGFGRVVIEAQAMGVPVVASGHGGAKETVIQSKTGWLTPPGDARALAQALETVLALPAAERQTYAVRARAHIRDHFTTASTTSKTLEIYRDLLQNRAK